MTAAREKRSIRIIKRNELERIDEQPAPPAIRAKTESQSRREIVATIASWIEERRQMMRTLPRFNNSAF